MDEQSILKAKLEHHSLYTVADQPMDITMTATLNKDQLRSISEAKGGHVIPISQVVDNYDDVVSSLKKKLAFNYSLEDSSKFKLNFLLLDANISDIQSPDNNGGMVIGGSLAFPNMYSSNMPIDEVSKCGKYRKVLDLDAPTHYVTGQPHAFSHALKHSRVDVSHPLMSRYSKLNPILVFPDGTMRGSGGVPPPKFASLANDAMLHAHTINNDTMYPGNKLSTITEVLSAESSGHGGIKSQHLVAIPNSAWPRSWYTEKKSCDREEGAVVPLGDYAKDMYEFIDNYNQSRSTNFDKCGIWWNAECLKTVPQIKAKLGFRIVPIVPKHKEGKELIPYNNYLRHLTHSIRKVDKPFQEYVMED
jgi:hypothetical protein